MGLSGSKYDRVGACVRDCLVSSNAAWNSSDHIKSFLVLRRGLNGLRMWAMVLVLADSWLASPMKERRSVRLDGVGKLAMASAMWGSTR